MTDDPARIVALALAEDICPGCICANRKATPRTLCRNQAPCPFFHPDNFYYDSTLRRFWCLNWVNERGETAPAM